LQLHMRGMLAGLHLLLVLDIAGPMSPFSTICNTDKQFYAHRTFIEHLLY
jgi:hypothetical protein